MFTETSAESASKPAPFKKSHFNKPAWSKPQTTGDALNFFHRSRQTYVDIAAEEERRRKRKLARKEKERARTANSEEREDKRRRLSDYSDDDDDQSSSGSEREELTKPVDAEVQLVDSQKPSSPKRQEISPKSLLKRYEESVILSEYEEGQPSEKKLSQSHIIDLDERESPPRAFQEDQPEITTVTAIQPPQDEDYDFLASAEEFPELARKAREKARQKRLEAGAASASLDPSQSNRGDESLQRSLSSQQPTPSPQPTDDIVSILITSRIANTTPLIVNRRISQRLKDVRVTWCDRQGFTPEATATIFLTWRGKRLFDVTTCKSLGIGVGTDGTIVMKGEKDLLGEEERQIHMEAMTEEILEDYKQSKRRAIDDEDTKEIAKQDAEQAEQKPEEQLRIILKAKDLDEFKLKVKPVFAAYLAIPLGRHIR